MRHLNRVHKIAALSTCALTLSAVSSHTASADEYFPPLLPQITCKASICKIVFSGVFGGESLTTDVLEMKFSTEEIPNWQPRFQSTDMLKMEGIDATYGWWIGENSEVEIYLTPLGDPIDYGSDPSASGLFMIEQRAGFERVGVAYKFIAINYDRSRLVTVLDIPPAIGPQKTVTAADIYGVRLKEQRYNPETGGFDPAYIQYEWYSGADSESLGSVDEIDAINSQNDAVGNAPEE